MMKVYSKIKIFERCDLYYLEFEGSPHQGELKHCIKMSYEMFRDMQLGDNDISFMLSDGFTPTRYGYILDMIGENVDNDPVYNKLVMFKKQFDRGSKIDIIVDE